MEATSTLCISGLNRMNVEDLTLLSQMVFLKEITIDLELTGI